MNERRATTPAATPVTPAKSPSASRAPLQFHIEKLSLHGYTPTQQQRFMQTLETSLSHLATLQDGRALASRHLPQLEPMRPTAGTSPEDAAQRLAQQLWNIFADTGTERRRG